MAGPIFDMPERLKVSWRASRRPVFEFVERLCNDLQITADLDFLLALGARGGPTATFPETFPLIVSDKSTSPNRWKDGVVGIGIATRTILRQLNRQIWEYTQQHPDAAASLREGGDLLNVLAKRADNVRVGMKLRMLGGMFEVQKITLIDRPGSGR